MADTFVHDTAQVKNSQLGKVKIFRNAVVNDCMMADGCSIGDDTTIERSKFENNVAINRRSYVNDSVIGKYSYAGINLTMNYTRLGRFCSLGRNVDVGGFDHDYHKVTTMPEFRINQLLNGGGKIPQVLKHELCEIGNDVWIAAGAQVLHKVKIGNGAVIGGGAVVTHDVPPYAIAVGIPAKIIGYRCAPEFIERLEKIQWWNWSDDVLRENIDWLIHSEINEETVSKMEEISKKLLK